MKTRFTAFLILAFVFITIATYGQWETPKVYVNSSSGNDATGNGTAGNPYKTFHKGYQMVGNGQILNLTGTFTWTDADETGDAAISGYTINKGIIIQGQGAGLTIVQAAATQNTADRRVFTIGNPPSQLSIIGITIRYGKISTTSGNNGAGIGMGTVTSSTDIVINQCNIEYNDYNASNISVDAGGGGIGLNNPYSSWANVNRVLVRGCNIRYNNSNTYGAAIYCRYGADTPVQHYLTLERSTVNNNNSSAYPVIYTYNTVSNVINTTIAYNTGKYAFSNYTKCYMVFTNVTVAYNNLYDNSGSGVSFQGTAGSSLYLRNCIFARNIRPNSTFFDYERTAFPASDYVVAYNLAEVTTSDDFLNVANRNIHPAPECLVLNNNLSLNGSSGITPTLKLESNSIAINAGTTVGHPWNYGAYNIPTVDQREFSRLDSTDLGAYEFTGTSVAPEATLGVSSFSEDELSYYYGYGPGRIKSFTVSGHNLTDNVVINSNSNFEFSTGGACTSSFTPSLTLIPSGGILATDTIYVRLKAGLNVVNSAKAITITSHCLLKIINCTERVKSIPANTRIWSGNTSTVWNTATNWSGNTVPNTYAIIPGGCRTNNPIVGNSKVSPANILGLTVEKDANLTIDADKALTVGWDIANDGEVLVKSTSGADGSLIVNGAIYGTGSFNIERYIDANKWHLVSSPISHTHAGIFTNLYLRPYLEATDVFGPYITIASTLLTHGKGYSLWANSNSTVVFSGTPISGNFGPIAIAKTFNGYNLVGNPYPSAIDWNATGWTKTKLAGTIYTWDPSGSGQYLTYNTTSGGTGSRYIAMGQGFFVQATQTGARYGMTNDVKVHNTVPFLKSDEIISDQIKIKVSNSVNTYSDVTIIALNDTASDSFDYDLDAAKFQGEDLAPMLYTMKDDENLAVSNFPSIDNIYNREVYFKAGVNGTHTLTFTHTLVSNNAYLLDKVTQEKINNGDNYTFEASPTDDLSRFVILPKATSVYEKSPGFLNAFSYNKTLYVKVENQYVNSIEIYTLDGRKLLENSNLINDISSLSAGIYLVKVKTDKDVLCKKIAIQ
ncbi:MAG: T9SS type A sorting domain-containing protein [Bacteroidetes bacterium]|nr:T9SS type A sorting domain-containing protein [Bacteroidota bacterium]